MVLATQEAYLKQMEKHAVKDPVVSVEQVVAQEDALYDHTMALLRSFGFGREHPGEYDRIVQSMKPGYCAVAPLSGEWKDHKSGWTEQDGPPVRPIGNGNIGANAAAGWVASTLIRPLRTDLNEIVRLIQKAKLTSQE